MRPLSSAIVDLATVLVAGDQLTGDEVCSRAVFHSPWIVAELAAPLNLNFTKNDNYFTIVLSRGVGRDVGGGHHDEGVDEDIE